MLCLAANVDTGALYLSRSRDKLNNRSSRFTPQQEAGMDFTLPPDIEELRMRTRLHRGERATARRRSRKFFRSRKYSAGATRAGAGGGKKIGLWAPQSPKEFGGMAPPIAAWVRMYEEAARSIFGALAMNCSPPDDGNMNLLARPGMAAQEEWWLRPVVEGKVKSAFAMTESASGGGSDPSRIRARAAAEILCRRRSVKIAEFSVPTRSLCGRQRRQVRRGPHR
jgi:alkylation response protein AidB-like acyl-CoA dehydrogenase